MSGFLLTSLNVPSTFLPFGSRQELVSNVFLAFFVIFTQILPEVYSRGYLALSGSNLKSFSEDLYKRPKSHPGSLPGIFSMCPEDPLEVLQCMFCCCINNWAYGNFVIKDKIIGKHFGFGWYRIPFLCQSLSSYWSLQWHVDKKEMAITTEIDLIEYVF